MIDECDCNDVDPDICHSELDEEDESYVCDCWCHQVIIDE